MDNNFLNKEVNVPSPYGGGGNRWRKILFVVVTLLVLAAVSTAVYWFYLRGEAETPRIYTSEEMKSQLTPFGKISFPEYTLGGEVELSKLPEALRELIVKNATSTTNVKVNEINYTDGKKGYMLTYEMRDISMIKFSGIVEKVIKDKWEILFGSRANIYGFKDLNSADWQVRINFAPFSRTDQNNLNITLQAMEIKK